MPKKKSEPIGIGTKFDVVSFSKMKYIYDNYGSIAAATSSICLGAQSRGAQEVSTGTDEKFDNFYVDVWFGSVCLKVTR